MNNQSPLVPQGSFLEQRNKGRARVKIAVFVVLAIHGIGLLALLMQGCKKEPETTAIPGAGDTNTTAAPAFVEPTNALPPLTNQTAVATNITPPPVEPIAPPVTPQVGAPSDYKVVKGDTYTTIARKFHTTTRALTDANPGVDPTKLQIGQTLHIPAPTAAPSAGSGTTLSNEVSSGEQIIYAVQSGDTLTKIAEKFKVTVKAIRSANNLTTDRIRVAQKLKIPAKAPAPPPVPASTTTAPTSTTPSSTTPPQ